MLLILAWISITGFYLSAKAAVINFGFPRYPERDMADWQVGMQVAICEANAKGTVPGYNFSLMVYNTPACIPSQPADCNAQAAASSGDFFGNISAMSAVLTPDWWISDSVLRATAAAKVPVISPKTFDHATTEHAVFLNQRIDADVPHKVSYMLKRHECAHTGLIMTQFLGEQMGRAADMQRAFVYGGYPSPPLITTNATNAELLHFILGEDPDRQCFIMQITIDEMYNLMSILKADNRFDTKRHKFFAVNNIEVSTYQSGNDTSVFDSLHITRYSPSFTSNASAAKEFNAAFGLWLGSDARPADLRTLQPTDVAPTAPSEPAFFTYLATRYVIELVKVASESHRQLGTVPAPSEILDVAYLTRVYVGGLVYYPLIRRCPDAPFAQLCFCNVAARATYTFKVNGSTGKLIQMLDDTSKGEVGVATTVLSGDLCSPPVIDNANYPIIVSVILPTDGPFQSIVSSTLRILNAIVAAINVATPAPTRPFRIYSEQAALSGITNEFKETIARRVQPFITAMAMGSALNRSSTLLVYPNADTQRLEEKPLSTYTSGDENILSSVPTIADCIHSLVAYYAQGALPGQYTGLSALATTEAEAILIRQSLDTFQQSVTVTVIEANTSLYADAITLLAASSPNHFVIVSAWNNPALVAAVVTLRNVQSAGTIAICTYEGALTNVEGFDTMVGDVLFVSMMSEWWLDDSSMRRYWAALTASSSAAVNPFDSNSADIAPHMTTLVFGFTYQVAQQATAASSTASRLLYQVGTISVGDVTFGPFSNATCSPQFIETNGRDRSCQCYKGPRTFYVHSMQDLNQGTASLRTGRFRYGITTCGVVYEPFRPLPPPRPCLVPYPQVP